MTLLLSSGLTGGAVLHEMDSWSWGGRWHPTWQTERQPLSTRDKVGSYTEMELFLESSDLQEFLMGANGACRS